MASVRKWGFLGSLIGHTTHGVNRSIAEISAIMGWFGESGAKLTDWLGADPAFGRAPEWHCSRSSIGLVFGYWRPSVFSCVALSGIRLASLHLVTGTDRCPRHRRYLPTTGCVSSDNLKAGVIDDAYKSILKCLTMSLAHCYPYELTIKSPNIINSGILIYLFEKKYWFQKQSREDITLNAKRLMSSFWKNSLGILPVLPIPALQWTTIGGPCGWPAHWGPKAFTIFLCCLFTAPRKSMRVTAEVGTP